MSKRTAAILIYLLLFSLFSNCGGGGGPSYTVGGTIYGLTGTLVLQNNGGNNYMATADGPFTFSVGLADGSTYSVTVLTTPSDLICNITNAAGTVSGANVTSVIVACHDSSTFSVGGTVSGLSGTLVLQNNGGDDLTVTTDGSFTFITALDDGETYEASVLTQPTGQTCYLSNASGTIAAASVTDISVTCYDSGSLDASFNGTGIVKFDGGFDDAGYGITTDSSGRILVTGYISDEDTPGEGKDVAVWRYNSDGSIDTTFGTNGVVTYHGGYRHDWGNSIVADDSDWVTACGQVNPGGSSINMVILRYNSDGEPDSTFGIAGVVTYVDTDTDVCTCVRLDDDNMIVANGYVASNMAIWRYLEDGSLDLSFGSGGVVKNSAGASFAKYSFLFDSGDNINVSGASDSSGMTIWRYGPTGTLSTNFGSGGTVTYTGGADELSRAIGFDSSEYIFTAGYFQPVGASVYDMTVWKYTPGGDVLTSFGDSGLARYTGNSNQTEATAMAVDALDRPLTTGYDDGGGSGSDLYIWRITAEGLIDTGFGSDGVFTYDGGAGDFGYDIALDSEGRILVTGSSSNGSDLDMVILRVHP